MFTEIRFNLDAAEQVALAESALDCPLKEIASDSIEVQSAGDGRVIVRWTGLRIIPLKQS